MEALMNCKETGRLEGEIRRWMFVGELEGAASARAQVNDVLGFSIKLSVIGLLNGSVSLEDDRTCQTHRNLYIVFSKSMHAVKNTTPVFHYHHHSGVH